ncbi:MAG TPA: hypothetical protein VNJ08_04115 [Bacteriovoracaceae bacterium]|nr:hypothetical protein [Bacteriovoracaceae bacterium]
MIYSAHVFNQQQGYINLALFGVFLIADFYSYSFSPKISFNEENVIFPMKGYWNWNNHSFHQAKYDDIYVLDILKTQGSFFYQYRIHFKAADDTITSVTLNSLMLKQELKHFIENDLLTKARLEPSEDGVLGKRFSKMDSPLQLDSLMVFSK